MLSTLKLLIPSPLWVLGSSKLFITLSSIPCPMTFHIIYETIEITHPTPLVQTTAMSKEQDDTDDDDETLHTKQIRVEIDDEATWSNMLIRLMAASCKYTCMD